MRAMTLLPETTLANDWTTLTNLSTTVSPCFQAASSAVATNTNSDSSTEATVALTTRIAYAYVSPVVILFGIIGDFLTIFILNHPVLRRNSVLYSYLTILAFTDLCTQISVIPMILWFLKIRWCSAHGAVYYAHVGFPLTNAFMGASVWIVVFLTLSQYVAVCHPFSSRLRSRKTGFILSAAAYSVSFAFHWPWALKKITIYSSSSEATLLDKTRCAYIVCDNESVIGSAWYSAYEWARETLTRFLPFCLILYLNIRILLTYHSTKVERLSRISKQQHGAVSVKAELEERRLLLLLITITGVFFVCTIPAALIAILTKDHLATDIRFQVIRATVNVLEFTKFALNFYFYCMINPDIRKLAIHLLLCRRLEKPAMIASKNVTQLSSISQAKRRAAAAAGATAIDRPTTAYSNYSVSGASASNSRKTSYCRSERLSLVPSTIGGDITDTSDDSTLPLRRNGIISSSTKYYRDDNCLHVPTPWSNASSTVATDQEAMQSKLYRNSSNRRLNRAPRAYDECDVGVDESVDPTPLLLLIDDDTNKSTGDSPNDHYIRLIDEADAIVASSPLNVQRVTIL